VVVRRRVQKSRDNTAGDSGYCIVNGVQKSIRNGKDANVLSHIGKSVEHVRKADREGETTETILRQVAG
jgi:hypothetical protein